MEYVSMYKSYYTYNNQFNNYYYSLFNSSSTIKLDFYIHRNQSFVNINNELLTLVEDIYDLNNKIVSFTYANKRLPKVAMDWFVRHTLIEEIKQSNQLEGVASTRKQIKILLDSTSSQEYKRLSSMVNKYQELLHNQEFVVRNIGDIKDLYNKIFLKDILIDDIQNRPDGEIFRAHGVNVECGGHPIHEGLKGEKLIEEAMSLAINILNDEKISLLIRVAIFHYLIGYIHPYYDGNGRLSRLISCGYLCKNLSVISALQLSISCIENKYQYYNIFKITNDTRNKADLTYFIISFLEILKDGLSNSLEFISTKVEQYEYYSSHIFQYFKKGKKTSTIHVLLQSTLFANEGITIKELCEISGLSDVTMRNYIKEFESQGIIIVNKESKPYQYDINLHKLNDLGKVMS